MEGMNVDTESNEGKLFAAVVDVLDEIALEVEDLTDEVMELGDGLDVISDDLSDVEDIVYDEWDDDDDDEDDEEDGCAFFLCFFQNGRLATSTMVSSIPWICGVRTLFL